MLLPGIIAEKGTELTGSLLEKIPIDSVQKLGGLLNNDNTKKLMNDIGLPGVMTAFLLATLLARKENPNGLSRKKYWKPIKNFNNSLNLRIKKIEDILGAGGHVKSMELNYEDDELPNVIDDKCTDCSKPECECEEKKN